MDGDHQEETVAARSNTEELWAQYYIADSAQGRYSTDAVVLVQKGAPYDLLLGTDVQSKLGFALLMKKLDKPVDLLTGRSPNTTQAHSFQPGEEPRQV